jgi:hypothetical protein
VLGLLGALVLLTSCSDFVDRDQTALAPERAVILEPGHAVGQTFVARHGGLMGWNSGWKCRRGVQASSASTSDLNPNPPRT